MIALAAVLAFGLNYLALQDRDSMTMVALAARPIAAGTPFTSELVRFDAVPADFGGLPHLVTEEAVPSLEDFVVSRPIAEGELIDRSAVIAPGNSEGLRTMSIPVPVEHAAGARLVVGDRVDVISMVDGTPTFVAVDLEVVALADTVSTGLSATGPFHVVVGVDAEQALAVARAIEANSIEVLRSTGSVPLEDSGG